MTTSTERMLIYGFSDWEFLNEAVLELKDYTDKDKQLFNDINAVLARAREGGLKRGGDANDEWKAPMTSGSLLGELRFPLTDEGYLLRFYVAACNRSSSIMVGLLLADKLRNGKADQQVKETQQSDINEALNRLMQRDRDNAP